MTCVVAIEHDGEVLIGFDSFGATWSDAAIRRDPKAWRHPTGFVVGGTTSYRMLQVLRFHAIPVRRDHTSRWDGERWFQWAIEKYIPAVRAALKEHGITTVENSVEEMGQWLVGVPGGHLFEIASDFQVIWNARGYAAVGSGQTAAVAALHALTHDVLPDDLPPPRDLLLKALGAARATGAGVRAPFHVISTEHTG